MRPSLPVLLLVPCLAACGGSGTLPVESAPPPPPPPPPPTEVLAPAHLGLTLADDEVVAFGIDRRATYSTPTPEVDTVTAVDVGDRSQVVSVFYDPDSDLYTLTLPRVGTGTLEVYDLLGMEGLPATYTRSRLIDAGGSELARVEMPTAEPGGLETRYSAFGSWVDWDDNGDGTASSNVGHFVYGLRTPDEAMPMTGSATYEADVYAEVPTFYISIGGTALLTFDFAAGSLAGSLALDYSDRDLDDRYDGYDFGTLTFSDTVFTAGSPLYSGMFSRNGELVAGSFFDGSLTGPGAEEVIGRFALPLGGDETGYTVTGIWIGGR